MEIDVHIDALRTHGDSLGAAAAAAGLGAAVPTCPGWSVRDLVGHVGGFHRWATTYLTHGSSTREQTDAAFVAPGDDELLDWFRDGHATLIRTLVRADPELEARAFLPAPSPLAFWARRLAHETAIHRADADAAAGVTTSIATDFAADGLDELLLGIMSDGGPATADPPVSVGVETTDTGQAWTVLMGPEGSDTKPGPGAADVTVRGLAADVYLLLWNRRNRTGIDIDGDPAVLDIWRDSAKVIW